ncbi:hypothetical protein Aph01nite_59050 [Acrocarpospora phusangensis]|uniref:Uncharacterized protein n=1 Tax=Acrocarpospora phusangensis TaxID=1070424 RepID=A0A919QJQ4_9ACTN|nr:hypothetical protein [Acrocarpospora phusangensis]GIH27595.1 hypothetical protein Aph01nite_59050 [Acrocarpospora phusangensis]
MTDQAINYWDAWAAWGEGIDIKHRVLWGLQILWWARVAKAVAFISLLLVVFDLVGDFMLKRALKRTCGNGVVCIKRIQFKSAKIGARVADVPIFSGGVSSPRRMRTNTDLVFITIGLLVCLGHFWVLQRVLGPLNYLMQVEGFRKVIRVLTLIFGILAFHFDMLAS